jgi:hypothetical protein
MEEYRIDYRYYTIGGEIYHPPKMIVKRCLSSAHAQVKLEKYLKKKHRNFNRLEVISCDKDMGWSIQDLFNQFK